MKSYLHILLLAIFSSVALSVTAQIHEITQQGISFTPNHIEVNVGDTVRWIWTGGTHTTTSTTLPEGAAEWNTPLTSESSVVDYKVTIPGDYSYHCIPHQAMGMIGTFTASVPLGIEQDYYKDLTIFPNPVTSVFLVETENDVLFLVSIYDISGKQLTSHKYYSNQQIDISYLPNGMYIVKLFDSEKGIDITKKIMKYYP